MSIVIFSPHVYPICITSHNTKTLSNGESNVSFRDLKPKWLIMHREISKNVTIILRKI